jgi:protease I
MLTGYAAESLEVMYPYQRLREEGYDVDIAAPSRKKLRERAPVEDRETVAV